MGCRDGLGGNCLGDTGTRWYHSHIILIRNNKVCKKIVEHSNTSGKFHFVNYK